MAESKGMNAKLSETSKLNSNFCNCDIFNKPDILLIFIMYLLFHWYFELVIVFVNPVAFSAILKICQ